MLFMVECDKYDDDSLVFYFSGSSAEIKDNVGRCLESPPTPSEEDESASRVRMSPCNHKLNQKWYYDQESSTIKPYPPLDAFSATIEAYSRTDFCLKRGWKGDVEDQRVFLQPCRLGQNSFKIPSSWDPIMSTSSIYQEVRSVEDTSLCMEILEPDDKTTREQHEEQVRVCNRDTFGDSATRDACKYLIHPIP